MDESTLVKLPSHATRQILEQYDGPRGIEHPDECAERVARAAWDGLIVLLRQSFERGGPVVLEGLGSFVREGQGWSFMPSSALARAEAVGLGGEGQARLVGLALFYLDQATALLDRVPEDGEVRTERGQSPVLRELAGAEAGHTSRLSDAVRLAAGYMLRIADRLSPAPRAKAREMKFDFGSPVKQVSVEDIFSTHVTDLDITGGHDVLRDTIRRYGLGRSKELGTPEQARKPDETEGPNLAKS